MLAAFSCDRPADRVILATTTSVDNSGLLSILLPAFRRQTGVDVEVSAVGSGVALEWLSRRHASVAISHAPAREADLLRQGRWIYRKLMFNDFVLVGPPDDPAAVRGAPSVEDAMRRIAASPHRFISRGDASGTHERERDLWRRASIEPHPGQVVVAGSGMGATLRIAGMTRADTLTDRATLGQHADRGDLRIVYEGDPALVNTYAVLAAIDAPPAVRRLVDWLTDGAGRQLIGEYRTAAGPPHSPCGLRRTPVPVRRRRPPHGIRCGQRQNLGGRRLRRAAAGRRPSQIRPRTVNCFPTRS